jgi:hypothetical protein
MVGMVAASYLVRLEAGCALFIACPPLLRPFLMDTVQIELLRNVPPQGIRRANAQFPSWRLTEAVVLPFYGRPPFPVPRIGGM